MSRLPYMKFFPNDWIEGTLYLTKEEKSDYIDMIALSWSKPIPKERLPFIINRSWDDLSDFLKEKFIDNGDTIINKRVERDQSQYDNYIEKQRINGAKGGRPKTQKKVSNANTISSTIPKPNIPSLNEFEDYAKFILEKNNMEYNLYDFQVKAKYQTWKDNDWKNGHDKLIKNWKNAFNNQIQYLKPIYGNNKKSRAGISSTISKEIIDGLQS